MKNLLKKALVMAALAMCFGFAVYIGEVNMPAVQAVSPGDETVSQNEVPKPTQTPDVNQGGNQDWNFSCSSTDLGYDKDLEGQIGGTPEGGVIYITKKDDRNSLDFEMVKRIVDRDQTLVMEYTYNGADYRIVIPGKAAVIDDTVPIYGPLYLAAHYSSNAAVGGSSDGVTYTIAKGDTLSKIAATNGTTVAALTALNPQIKDINVIYVGQTINLQ